MKSGLYDSCFEHDSCGIGTIVDVKGRESHEIVSDALSIVEHLEHRAGKDAEGKTGDGVGILTQVPHEFLAKKAKALGISLPGRRQYGVGMFFFPQNDLEMRRESSMFEIIVKKAGLSFLGWRRVETRPEVLGSRARECMPDIRQAFIGRPEGLVEDLDFERKLYVVRREFEHSSIGTYVPSLSCRTIVYKGMFLVGELRSFFLDLNDPDYKSAIAMVHSRFSTNTMPSWNRAHPNRLLVHNGEINTIKGNADKMLAREETMHTDAFSEDDMTKVFPVIAENGSDSAMLDNTLEFLMMSGMPLPLAMTILLPEPWEHNQTIPQEERDFYQYYATMMEPWDGPASILFSDGDIMGAILDRNGLRPSRYYVMDDGRLILSSEVGVLRLPESHIVKKERLHPGKLLVVDTLSGSILEDGKLKERYAHARPYGEWLDRGLMELSGLRIPNRKVPSLRKEQRMRLEKAFGYTWEDVYTCIRGMALKGKEEIGSMGVDTPIAVLSKQYQPLFHYFKQLFAQVTNPPIDARREKIVTSRTVYLGKNGNLLEEDPGNCRVLRLENPILSDLELMKIEDMTKEGFEVRKLSTLYYKRTPMKRVLDRLFVEVDKAYKDGADILILSDRGVDENHVAIPSLLAVSAVHKHLVETRKCTAMSLILESGEPREVHHFAALLGFGASAINPYLAHAAIGGLVESDLLQKDYYAAVKDYDEAVLDGIVNIASKMGISTIQSYQGSKIFEALGVSDEVVGQYFPGTVSRIGGITLEDIGKAVDEQHGRAFDPLGLSADMELTALGRHKLRSQGESHRYNPATIHLLQLSVRTGDYELFRKYTGMADREESGCLRSLLDFNYPEKGVPLSEVEGEDSILRRFKTGAMSYGSISEEAHSALAEAMNRLHGKSNSGEGGESGERMESKGKERDLNSRIKQVASGRFGVTSRYLLSADEIQIKMAQGAKPGEGGHLPGKKVYPWIARTRHSTPGVSLISPPPHHDIYSIEDLAQLIYDLRNANRDARISVKLVSEAGVGTVAAGVAKAGAGVILVSGYDGGTGAAPLSSIHNAGLPWELGLAETHQTLVENGLRGRVALETDGKLMSGRDVAIAAMLGAEEFGFATAPLVALGCVMMRACQSDTCPMGIATQNPELRKRFSGRPEYVENFMRFIARQLREIMASLGVRELSQLVGRTDLLKKREGLSEKEEKLDFSGILFRHPDTEKHPGTEGQADSEKLNNSVKRTLSFRPAYDFDFRLSQTKDEKILLASDKIKKVIRHCPGDSALERVTLDSTDRAFGTLLGAEITRAHPEGLPEDSVTICCTGSGGQSFGAFIPRGLTLDLVGDCNDYLGKGLSGGKIIVRAPAEAAYDPHTNILAGNVALYGATSGKLFVAGMAGERFAVRNSGALTVVEGVGEHGCEYMTGGIAVILGPTGKNFAAGMSGGVAYVLDEENSLYRNLNKELVDMEELEQKGDIQSLKALILEHVQSTGSGKGREILDRFDLYVKKFKKIIPVDYKRIMKRIAAFEEKGENYDAAVEAAFEALTRGC